MPPQIPVLIAQQGGNTEATSVFQRCVCANGCGVVGESMHVPRVYLVCMVQSPAAFSWTSCVWCSHPLRSFCFLCVAQAPIAVKPLSLSLSLVLVRGVRLFSLWPFCR